MDLGFLWELGDQMHLGMFFRDLLNSMKYDNTARKVSYSEQVPRNWTIGFFRQFGDNVLLALDWEPALYKDTNSKVHTGTEIKVFHMLFLRAGMWQNLAADMNRNYSLGLGIHLKKRRFQIQFDFAYLINDLANSPRISLSLYH